MHFANISKAKIIQTEINTDFFLLLDLNANIEQGNEIDLSKRNSQSQQGKKQLWIGKSSIKLMKRKNLFKCL